MRVSKRWYNAVANPNLWRDLIFDRKYDVKRRPGRYTLQKIAARASRSQRITIAFFPINLNSDMFNTVLQASRFVTHLHIRYDIERSWPVLPDRPWALAQLTHLKLTKTGGISGKFLASLLERAKDTIQHLVIDDTRIMYIPSGWPSLPRLESLRIRGSDYLTVALDLVS